MLYAFGYSVNTLTMFAMVLAIGLLVDDAIVVVENVERIMSEEGLAAGSDAEIDGANPGALVGIAMVLSAVFIPMAFFGGTTGAIYRQFSITIVSAMVLSVLVAMILTPALCATLLKPLHKGEHHGQTGFFGWFNRMFNRNAERYEKASPDPAPQPALDTDLRPAARRYGFPVPAPANLLPAARRPRHVYHLDTVAQRLHAAANIESS